MNERKAIGGGFSGAGLGQNDEIAAILQQHRDNLGLDRGRFLETHFRDGAQDIRRQSETFKCRHTCSFHPRTGRGIQRSVLTAVTHGERLGSEKPAD